MSFGFSVGDIIAGASLCYKVSSAIKDGPAELNSARASLRSLTTLLERVDKEFGSLCEDEGRKEELVDIMVDCRSTVNKFKKVVEKYSDVDTGKKKRSMGLKVLKWSMKDKSALPEIQRAIGFHLGSLNAMMNVQHSSAIAVQEDQSAARHSELMDKLEEIRLAILEGQKNAALLLPALDLQTGETDISAIEEELINNGVPEEEVKDNTESIRDYVEKHRDEVSSVAALTQRDWGSVKDDDSRAPGGTKDFDNKSEYYTVRSGFSGSKTFIGTDSDSIILSSEYGVPWNRGYSKWLDMKDKLIQDPQHQAGIEAFEEEQGPELPVIASHLFCPLCLKVFPLRNLHDHITKVHDRLAKEYYLTALERAKDSSPAADASRWREIPQSNSFPRPPDIRTVRGTREDGDIKGLHGEPVKSSLQSLPSRLRGRSSVTSTNVFFQSFQQPSHPDSKALAELEGDASSSPDSSPNSTSIRQNSDRNGQNYKVSCPICFAPIGLNDFSGHIDSHEADPHVSSSTLSSWRTLLAPADGSISDLSPRNAATLLQAATGHGASRTLGTDDFSHHLYQRLSPWEEKIPAEVYASAPIRGPQVDFVEKLPIDLCRQIFSLLSGESLLNCALVNSRWCHITTPIRMNLRRRAMIAKIKDFDYIHSVAAEISDVYSYGRMPKDLMRRAAKRALVHRPSYQRLDQRWRQDRHAEMERKRAAWRKDMIEDYRRMYGLGEFADTEDKRASGQDRNAEGGPDLGLDNEVLYGTFYEGWNCPNGRPQLAVVSPDGSTTIHCESVVAPIAIPNRSPRPVRDLDMKPRSTDYLYSYPDDESNNGIIPYDLIYKGDTGFRAPRILSFEVIARQHA